MMLFLGALYFLNTNKDWWATSVLALAGFARETNVLGVAMFEPAAPWKREGWLVWGLKTICVLAPLAFWAGWLSRHFSNGNIWNSGNLYLPGFGLAAKLAVNVYNLWVHPNNYYYRANMIMLLAMVFRGGYLCLNREWRDPVWRLGAGYVLLALCLGNSVWEGYPGAYLRVLIPLTFAYNLRLPSSSRGCLLALIGNIDAPLFAAWIYYGKANYY
jgi:hypothetical protein